MSNQEKNIVLAEFLNLDIVDSHKDGLWYRGEKRKLTHFGPYVNENHARQVEEKFLEDGKGKLCKKYLAYFESKAHYIASDREERMDAAISVLTKKP